MNLYKPYRVAVLGTGAIGTAVARALLTAGHEVAVWNRTTERASEARSAGAVVAASATEAVRSSGLTLVCMTDQDAARGVLSDVAEPTDGNIRTVVLLTTGTPEESMRMEQTLTERSLQYLDAGVQTSPENVGTPAARFIVAGPRTAFDQHRAVLEGLGTIRWVGSTPSAASLWDLVSFGLWYDAQVGLLRALEILRASDVDPRSFIESATVSLGFVADEAAATAEEVAAKIHPRGAASLEEHLTLVRQLIEGRRTARTGDGGLTHLESLIAELVAKGASGEGLSAIVADTYATGTGPAR